MTPGTAAPGTAQVDDAYVEPFDPSRFTAGLPTDADSERIRAILTNSNKYALTTWWHTVKDYDAQTGEYLDLGGVGEHDIRPPASEAYGLAAALATGAYDADATGVDEATAREITAKLARSVAYRHAANSEGGWGNEWQSAYWAALGGTAGWLLWDELSATDREYVRTMVEYEANRFIGWPVPYWKNRDGSGQRPCDDTAAEESAWNARLMFLAQTMLPRHSRLAGWAYKANELSTGAYSRLDDVTDTTDMRGRPLGDWLEGSNVNNDGSLVNHNFYHPDYQTAITETISGSLVHALGGQPIPANALVGASVQYDGLVDRSWWPSPNRPCADSPGYIEPGPENPTGTMYIDDSSAVYYPQGNDWGTMRRLHFAELDVVVRAFGLDNLVEQKAGYWEDLHAQIALEMQERPLDDGSPSDGSTYRTEEEDNYPGREEWIAVRAGGAWLTKWLDHQGALTTTNSAAQIVVDDGDRGVTVDGTWTTGDPDANGPQVFGRSVRYKPAGDGASYVRFTPRLSQTRSYEVYAWWVAASAQATNTPFTIDHADGSTVVTKDQRTGGGRWQSLGTYELGPGDFVQVNDNADGYVVADAIRLVPR